MDPASEPPQLLLRPGELDLGLGEALGPHAIMVQPASRPGAQSPGSAQPYRRHSAVRPATAAPGHNSSHTRPRDCSAGQRGERQTRSSRFARNPQAGTVSRHGPYAAASRLEISTTRGGPGRRRQPPGHREAVQIRKLDIKQHHHLRPQPLHRQRRRTIRGTPRPRRTPPPPAAPARTRGSHRGHRRSARSCAHADRRRDHPRPHCCQHQRPGMRSPCRHEPKTVARPDSRAPARA